MLINSLVTAAACQQNFHYPESNLELQDIQGILKSGYRKLKASSFVLLRIVNTDAAAKYLLEEVIRHIVKAGESKEVKILSDELKFAIHLAFTNTGLQRFLPEQVINAFSRPFTEGMVYNGAGAMIRRNNKTFYERECILGDIGPNSRSSWKWGIGEKTVDCMLMLYAEDESSLKELKAGLFDNLKNKGVEEIVTLTTNTFEIEKEHFGFKDGISQPAIRGFKEALGAKDSLNLIYPGEIILGYKNEYGSYAPTPFINECENSILTHKVPGESTKLDLGKNGSYLVIRQMEQHVERFWRYMYDHSIEKAATKEEAAILLAEKMVGRKLDGTPLSSKNSGKNQNEFDFRDDTLGQGCPFGAHIRRVNPRDQTHAGRSRALSGDISKKHRMLRRGRIYGEPLANNFDVKAMIEKSKNATIEDLENWSGTRGLHFLALVSDINRNFEFVQNAWCNTPTFAELTDETDPIISGTLPFSEGLPHFTTPQKLIRNRYKDVPPFTRVVGGAYFFLPGIKALNYILECRPDRGSKPVYSCPYANTNQHVKEVSDYLQKKRIEKYPTGINERIFHVNSIGWVSGTLKVDSNINVLNRKGLFKNPEDTYEFISRFSTSTSQLDGDESNASQTEKGLYGFAIKIFTGREAPEAVQDLILLTSDIFVPTLPKHQISGVKVVLGNNATRIKMLIKIIKETSATKGFVQTLIEIINFLKARKQSKNILTESYNSATPFLFLDRAVKWHAIPSKKNNKPPQTESAPNHLSKLLEASLSKGPVVFDLYIQPQQNEVEQPIEDSGRKWESDLEKVGELILKEFKEMEDRSVRFCPDNCVKEHTPLGEVNAIRSGVYKQMQK